jgi:hypothetical protein
MLDLVHYRPNGHRPANDPFNAAISYIHVGHMLRLYVLNRRQSRDLHRQLQRLLVV